MKVFISWSGERSRQVAELLNVWSQCVLQAIDPWLSTKDIDKGSVWFSEITNQLSNTQNGIVCLTKSNLNNPWILFEAGALAKGLSSNRVFTFLIDLKPNEVKDPLAQFNHTLPTKDGIFQLVRTINNNLNEGSLKENIISNVFDTYWPQFEKKFKEILLNTPEEEIKEERPKEDVLNEILYSVRAIDKRLRKVEEFDHIPYQPAVKNKGEINFGSLGELPIESLDMSVRLLGYLKSKNIHTVKDASLIELNNINNLKFKFELTEILLKLLKQNEEKLVE